MKWFFSIALLTCQMALFCDEPTVSTQFSQDLPEEEEELIVYEEGEFDDDDF